MGEPALRVLQITADPVPAQGTESEVDADFGPFEVQTCSASEALRHLTEASFDALVAPASWTEWTQLSQQLAVLLIAEGCSPAQVLDWFRAGAQDVLSSAEQSAAAWPRRLRAAIERQRVRAASRQAFSTDVHTGLPHAGQLMEHMSHLLALRAREPAPMALLVLRIEGLASTLARVGAEAAGTLRRKVAVRLRAGVRASDVVASLGDDSFAVLLSLIDTPADADRVARKLLVSLGETFKVAGSDLSVATALGIAAYPADGTQPEMLLRRAVGLAASAQATGRAGYSNRFERGDIPAANDDHPG